MKTNDELIIHKMDTEKFDLTFVKDDNSLDNWVFVKQGLTTEQMLVEVDKLAKDIFEGWENNLDVEDTSA
jgi:hypothetical protein